ncbi:glutathione S-transferase family protein [Pseudoroseicyclus tamaricis]|uniref:Glutathione S-transferase family protein n=1 Tax=Pseudoroseicyclus tamaricis TaxID=2705421 RepID=A0A6B2JTD9_9RHOB|nr:glutathione S-transferase family protein [Pseudoroseicyclus tamaricis]NDU99443.1 glutathione S-transferase family protein [Pseudoroseicyclus tamaricis]
MGQLVDGTWEPGWYDTKKSGGAFQRSESSFRNWVTEDGSAGPSGKGGFKAESGRYHLYVSYACPWAHRALIMRELKGLEPHIDISVVHPDMLEDGWTFDDTFDGSTGDQLYGLPFLRDIYVKSEPEATTRVTVPVLWDKETETIVSNESAEIIRMFNTAFDSITGSCRDFYPEHKRDEIDEINARVYDTVNNGVYKAGFATKQGAYDSAVGQLFESLDWLEDMLMQKRFLTGDDVTEADIRLLTTLLRFDPVYHGHFKCNRRRLVDYPNLWGYTRDLYQMDGVSKTVRPDHYIRHYHYSHDTINPNRIIPVGPEIDYTAPPGREGLSRGH